MNAQSHSYARRSPSHGRGRRFNPYSAHQPSLLRSYGWQANACTLLGSSEGCPSKPAGRTRAESMKYVYLLQSVEFSDETYVGLTDDLRSRFTAHNTGRSPHTAKYKPWRLVTYVAFSDERKAVEFERYLKSASGRAFPRSAYASRNWRLDSKTKVRRGDRA